MQETQVQFLDQEEPLENKMGIHSNILAWEIPQRTWWVTVYRIRRVTHNLMTKPPPVFPLVVLCFLSCVWAQIEVGTDSETHISYESRLK